MNLRRTVAHRMTVAVTAAALAVLSVSAGAAMTASAASDPNSQPGQIVTDWDPGTSATWTIGNSGTPWVADRYAFDADDGDGAFLYHTNDGVPPTYEDNANFARNLNFQGGCFGASDSTQVVCFE